MGFDNAALDGKVAIVTGAGTGLGRAEAIRLAHAGARVVVNDVGGNVGGIGNSTKPADDVVDEIRSAGGMATPNYSDVGESGSAEELLQQAVHTYGGLDILVNNAGIQPTARLLPDVDLAEFDRVMRVHVRGAFSLSIAATSYWRTEASKAGSPVDGRIVNTASEAFLIGLPLRADYTAAKSAIIGLTLSTDAGCREFGVRVNAICPRASTRMTAHLESNGPGSKGGQSLAPEAVADLVVALVGPRGAAIYGQVLVAYGDTVEVLAPPRVVARLDASTSPVDALIEDYFREHPETYSIIPGGISPSDVRPGDPASGTTTGALSG